MPTSIVGDAASRLSTARKKSSEAIHVATQVIEAARAEVSEVLDGLGSSLQGLTESEVEITEANTWAERSRPGSRNTAGSGG